MIHIKETYEDKITDKESGKNKPSEKNKPPENTEKYLLQLKAEVVSNKENQEADNILVNNFGVKKESQEQIVTPKTDIQTTISNLHRPQAEAGLLEAYTNIQNTIKNSPNDKNRFARLIGKGLNKILNA